MTKQNKHCISTYIKYINSALNIPKNYTLILTKKRDDSLKTYAYYSRQKNEDGKHIIKIYIKNRSMADVLRSIAHELVHHHQNYTNQLPNKSQDVGGKIENDANSMAGMFVKKFGYKYPNFNIYTNNF